MNNTISLTYFSSFLIILFIPGVTLAQWQPQTTEELQTAVDVWVTGDSMGREVSAGVYLYQIQTGEFIQTKKMVQLK